MGGRSPLTLNHTHHAHEEATPEKNKMWLIGGGEGLK